jgi:PhnB protein
MTKQVNPIPEGYHALTPVLTVKNGAAAIEFYKNAFGAKERYRMPGPEGTGVMHAELIIGDSIFMMGEEMPGQDCRSPESLGGTPVSLYMYVEDVDAAFKNAIEAGAKEKMPVQDMFWGDRIGEVVDPSGHRWTLATHVEDLSEEEIAKRAVKFFANCKKETK